MLCLSQRSWIHWSSFCPSYPCSSLQPAPAALFAWNAAPLDLHGAGPLHHSARPHCLFCKAAVPLLRLCGKSHSYHPTLSGLQDQLAVKSRPAAHSSSPRPHPSASVMDAGMAQVSPVRVGAGIVAESCQAGSAQAWSCWGQTVHARGRQVWKQGQQGHR